MSNIGSQIVDTARKKIGTSYSKLDCSKFVQWTFKQYGVKLPRTAAAQAQALYEQGREIDKKDLKPGDLVFWRDKKNKSRWEQIHHVGIYAGNGKVIESKTSTKGVVEDKIWSENGKRWEIVMYARPKVNGNDMPEDAETTPTGGGGGAMPVDSSGTGNDNYNATATGQTFIDLGFGAIKLNWFNMAVTLGGIVLLLILLYLAFKEPILNIVEKGAKMAAFV